MFNLASNGMGGMDGSLVEIAIATFGVQDVEGLMHRLQVIKSHEPPKDQWRD